MGAILSIIILIKIQMFNIFSLNEFKCQIVNIVRHEIVVIVIIFLKLKKFIAERVFKKKLPS